MSYNDLSRYAAPAPGLVILAKDPLEFVFVYFDFTGLFVHPDEYVYTVPTVTCSVIAPGVDSAAASMIVGAATIINSFSARFGTVVKQLVKLGVSGNQYLLTCPVGSNYSLSYTALITLPVLTTS